MAYSPEAVHGNNYMPPSESCESTNWFVSDLVEKPEEMFSLFLKLHLINEDRERDIFLLCVLT